MEGNEYMYIYVKKSFLASIIKTLFLFLSSLDNGASYIVIDKIM